MTGSENWNARRTKVSLSSWNQLKLLFLEEFWPFLSSRTATLFHFSLPTDTSSVRGCQWWYYSACSSNTPRFNPVTPLSRHPWHLQRSSILLFDHPDFRQYHSRVNTLSAAVMTPCVIFLLFPPIPLISNTPHCWCRTALSEASFPHACAMLCKWLRTPGWKSLPLFHFTRWKEPVKASNDWGYSPSMVATVGGPEREDGYDTLIE